jgi:hypothetical protein
MVVSEIQGAKVIVTMLVLAAVLLAIMGIIVSLIPPRPFSGVDESGIHTAEELDAAMATQRSMRIAELQRRMANRNHWSYSLFALAFLMQMTAFAVDHFAHLSIAAITILPGFFTVLTARAARRRAAHRQLDTFIRSGRSSPVT